VKGIGYFIALSLILLFLKPQNQFAQPQYINHEVFNEINGLPNNEVRSLLKDSRGYLWVGTIYGLAKYDGNKFSVFKHQSDKNSVSGDVISTIFEDNNGNILIGANGLSVLERKTGVWKNYLHDPSNPFSISNPSVSSISQENDSIFWVITGNGINRFNLQTGRFQLINFQPNSRIFFSKIHEIIPDESITFSISSTFYLYSLLNDTYQALPVGQGYSKAIVFNNHIIGLKNTEPNRFNLIKFNISTKQESVLLNDVSANGTVFYDKSSLYFIHNNRICIFDLNINHKNTIVFQQQKADASAEYHDALREENGTFWIATNNGLLKVSPDSPFHFLDSKSGLPNDYIRSLIVDSYNNLWIGVRDGTAFKLQNIDDYLIKRIDDIQSIPFPKPNDDVHATNEIVELKDGNILFVTRSTLYYYNVMQSKFIDQLKVKNNRQFFSAVETNGGVLVGSLEKPSLFRISIKAGKMQLDNSFRITNPPDVVNSLYKDSEDRIWVGGEGLYYLDFDNSRNEATAVEVIPGINNENYSSNSVWSILQIDRDRLFVSTTTNGFYIYHCGTNSYKHFSKADGISTDFTCGVLKDHNDNLWMSTKEGITFIDLKDYSIKNYPIKNGQYYSDFTFKCAAKTQGNLLLFGSKQGIVFFNPDSVVTTEFEAPLYVNEFRVFDSIVKSELTHGDTIVLKHNENFFSFEFSLLDFRIPQEIKYNFQLLNYDRTERAVTNNFNSVSYTDVPPGNYTFSLSANVADYNTRQTIEIFLTIQPAYYQTSWFKISVYIAIFLVLGVIVITIARRQLLRQRLQKMELHLLRSQIDPHFIFNTLTSIQHTILKSSKEDSIDTLSRFSRLMRMSLDYSRMEYITLDEALHFYETFVAVHSLNLDENIVFNVVIDNSIDTTRVKISPMLIQPFIENAIVHGLTPKNKDMRIDMEVEQNNGWLSFVLRDNGIGRKRASEIGQKKAQGHKSMGIEISRKSILLQLKKGKFIKETFRIEDNTDESGNPLGTTVYLSIPYRL
jgi:ligand-binding sensor domain-containing protein